MSEDTNLTLPGDIPKLLRRGSPVTHIDGSRLVVVELDGGDAKLPSGWAFTRLLTLDLSDATGRAHAAWWLGQTLWPSANASKWVWSCDEDGWKLSIPGAWPHRWNGISGHRLNATLLPTLADLSFNDPRILSDGSRWAEAEALRRVCLHVAGLPLT